MSFQSDQFSFFSKTRQRVREGEKKRQRYRKTEIQRDRVRDRETTRVSEKREIDRISKLEKNEKALKLYIKMILSAINQK